MNNLDPHLLVRAASIYVTATLTLFVWAWRRPGSRDLPAALMAFAWNVPFVLALHLVATAAGWWRFDAQGGQLLGMPVDMFLSWAWLWGPVFALAFPASPVAAVLVLALAIDLVLMPLAVPVLQLGPGWLAGEAAGLALCVAPGQLLARWTRRQEQLAGRALLQIAAFTGLLVFVLPAIAIDGSDTSWRNPWTRPLWQISLLIQILALPAVVGLSAVQEFVERGGGTPVPFDPPKRMVTSGAYAYLRNPMQTSAVLLLSLLGLVLWNPWVAAAGVVAHIYSIGLAGWDEEEDLRKRFGVRWTKYRTAVPRWVPRLRPWLEEGLPPARLYVSSACGMCREVGRWFEQRGVRGLAIVPAESHHSRVLTRITYESADGSARADGIAAVARALEHLHLGWAACGWTLRLPIVRPAVQLLVDASGGGPRPVQSRVESAATCSAEPLRVGSPGREA